MRPREAFGHMRHKGSEGSMGRSEEFIEGEDCCNMTSKKLRLKGPRETVPGLEKA